MARRRVGTLPPLLCALATMASASFAEVAVRITDLWPDGQSGVPNLDAAVLGDKLYFAATADGSDLDLWVYDGISAPSMVPGGAGLAPEELTVWQDALYFRGGPFADQELWRYDGVNPPVEVLDLIPPGSGYPDHLTAFGPELCFNAFTSETVGDELVCWDGATAPDVYELRAGIAGSSFEKPSVLGDTLYFDAYGDGVGSEPWAYEHFSPPTLVSDMVPGTGSSNPEDFAQVGGTIYFESSASSYPKVWSYDTLAPPALVSPTFRQQGGIASWGGRLIVDGYEGEGASLQGGIPHLHVLRAGGFVRAPWSGGGSISSAGGFLDHRNALYFRAGGSVTASDLFRYCGSGSVERVTDQFADVSYITSAATPFQGRLYFSANQAATGQELWALDPMTAVFCDGFEDGHDDGWSASVP